MKKYDKLHGYQKTYPNKQYNIEDYDFNTYVIPFNNNNNQVKKLVETALSNKEIKIEYRDNSKVIYMPVINLKVLWDIVKNHMNNSIYVSTIKISTYKINLPLLTNFLNTLKYFENDGELTLIIYDYENNDGLYMFELSQKSQNWNNLENIE